jgi:hypothetical protein
MNIDYFAESHHKQCLNSVPTSFNLTLIVVNFTTRIQNYSSSAIKNIFIDSSIEQLIHGLSDHNTRLLVIKNMEQFSYCNIYNKRDRLTNNDTITEFTIHLSNKNWESVLSSYDVNYKI